VSYLVGLNLKMSKYPVIDMLMVYHIFKTVLPLLHKPLGEPLVLCTYVKLKESLWVSAKGMWVSAKGMDSHMPLANARLLRFPILRQAVHPYNDTTFRFLDP